MEYVVPIYKKIGETPLEALQKFKENHPEYIQLSMSYAGRLDPMAEGILLIIIGPELKHKDSYQKLNKEYTAKILFGAQSDTGDVLGIIKNGGNATVTKEELEKELKKLYGKIEIQLPNFSSYKMQGKPLFWWTRQKRIHEIEVPKHTITIFSSLLKSIDTVSGEIIKNNALSKIKLVRGDFRQEDIFASWEQFNTREKYTIVEVSFSCSSGTYIRSLVSMIGEQLHTPALLLSLIRTRVGDYSLTDCIG